MANNIGFSGNTRIHTIDKISPRVSQVNSDDRFWGYSIDIANDIYASTIHSIRRIPTMPRLVKLTFHSGGSIIVTPNTGLGLANGRWTTAKGVQVGSRVMSAGLMENALVSPDGTLLRPVPTTSDSNPNALDWEPLGWYNQPDPRNRKAVLAADIVRYCIDRYGELNENNYTRSRTELQNMNRTVWGYPSFKSYMSQYDEEVSGVMVNWVTNKEWVTERTDIYKLSVVGKANLFVEIGDEEKDESHMVVLKIR